MSIPEAINILVEEDDPEYSNKWYGVPPAGERPVKNKTAFIFIILGVILLEFVLWGIYRYFTADFYGNFGTFWFYVGHIIAAPTIHLGPILIYWILIRKEKLFVKTDREGLQFNSLLFGPFKMTKKFLFSAVLVGLIGGIVWRVTEFVVADITFIALGLSTFPSMTLWDVFTGQSIGLFLLMTFVMFFIVGPVEEFEFRSFVHDQSARAMPLWGALIFSSVLFGLSHIPIAITVYKLTPIQLIFAEISWMTAGATFGALYMWSRNIFACIVMHGIGNWQLSVFFFQSETSGAMMTDTKYYIISFVTSILANAILIGLFFLINKFYWEPQRRGDVTILDRIDISGRYTAAKSGILTTITVVVLVVIVIFTTTFGSTDFAKLDPFVSGSETSGGEGLDDLVEASGIEASGGHLSESESIDIPFASGNGTIITSLTATLTWTDEPDIQRLRLYENQPDTFSLTVSVLNVSAFDSGSNAMGQDGSIMAGVDVTREEILANDDMVFTVTVSLDNCGMYSPRLGPGMIGLTDTGNDYDLSVEIGYLTADNGSENQEVEDLFLF